MKSGNIRLLPVKGPPLRAAFTLLALAPFAFGFLALALGQDANWDLRNYHWYNAYAFLNNRYGTDFLPSQTPWFYNPLLDLPFYLLATHAPARVAGFTLGFVQGFNFILLFLLAHAALIIERAGWKVGICAGLATIGMLGGGGIALIGTTFYDNVTSLGTFLSALLMVRYHGHLMRVPLRRAIFLAVLIGLPSGLMLGLKLPCVTFCVGLCFGILAMSGPFVRLFLMSFGFGIGVLAGATITLGHWAWFLDNYFGNPFFPYFNNYFQSSFAPLSSARDVKFVPDGFWRALVFPFIFAVHPKDVVGEIDWRDWGIPILYALLPVTLGLRWWRRRSRHKPDEIAAPHATRFLLAAAAITYFVWLLMFGIYRYAVPLEMLAPLLIVLACGLLPFTIKVRETVIAVLLIMTVLSVSPGNWSRREAWLNRFVEADIPPLGNSGDLMILMAGFEPYSHLVPEFPPDIAFLRIESNFSSFSGPDDKTGVNRILRRRIRAHNGPFMLLIQPYNMDLAKDALHNVGLEVANEPCKTVTDRLYEDTKLDLCKVVRPQTE